MEMLSTAGLPPAGRTAAWNTLYASHMSRVEFTPRDQQQFAAELRIGRLGPVKLARLTVGRCSVERDRSHIARNTSRPYNFLLQAKGSSLFHHGGHETSLSRGDIVLCDTGLPHFWEAREQSETIMVRVQPETLRAYLPTPERFRGRRLGGSVGLGSTVAAMVQTLSDQAEAGFGVGYEDRIARYLLEMLALSYTMEIEAGSTGSALLWQRRGEIVRYIEDNLRDPELSPASIAAGLRLSPRYLRTIFAISGEKVSAYMLRRRLEECARQIQDHAWHAHTLTEIAFSWGFNSCAHFTRSFHEQFGMAPRDYRRMRAI